MPAHAAASVTRQIRPGAAACAIAQTWPATWCRSAMRPLVSLVSVSAWPGTPGSRWCSGRWALNRWVTIRAPAPAAAATWAAVASLWPTLTTMPARASWLIAARPPSRSGARVTSLSRPEPAAISSSSTAGDGSVIHSGLCAPRRTGAMNGPSMCTPSTRAPSGRPGCSAAALRSEAASRSTGAVMIVGRNAVVPVSGRRRTTVAKPAAPAVPNSAPKYPLTCRSTKPGSSRPPGSSTSGGRGGGPDPAPATRPSRTRTYPGDSTPEPVVAGISRGAVSTSSFVAAPAMSAPSCQASQETKARSPGLDHSASRARRVPGRGGPAGSGRHHDPHFGGHVGGPLHLGHVAGPRQHHHPGAGERAGGPAGHPGIDQPVVAAVDDQGVGADPGGIAPQRGGTAAEVLGDQALGRAEQDLTGVAERVLALDLGHFLGDPVRVHDADVEVDVVQGDLHPPARRDLGRPADHPAAEPRDPQRGHPGGNHPWPQVRQRRGDQRQGPDQVRPVRRQPRADGTAE